VSLLSSGIVGFLSLPCSSGGFFRDRRGAVYAIQYPFLWRGQALFLDRRHPPFLDRHAHSCDDDLGIRPDIWVGQEIEQK